MRPRARTQALLLLACLLLAAAAACAALGARRIRAAAAAGAARELFVFEPLSARSLRFAGRDLTITDEPAEGGGEAVRVRYGPGELLLRPSVPPGPEGLPGLVRHEPWMRLLRFAPRRGRTLRELQAMIDAGEVADRLAIVTRTLRPGADPATWGEVWKKDWTFDFYEFTPRGEIAHRRLKYPSNRSGRPAGEGELAEGTWEWDAALMVMPRGAVPKAQFREDGWKAMGWTLPASMVCFLGFAGAVVAAFSTRGRAPATAAAG